jgi:cyclic pyranopterin phosphate synthase
MGLNHFDASGQAVMVDVSAKQITLRTAVAAATVRMDAATLELIKAGTAAKGDVLGVARLAGIAAAKKTPELIPLAHPLALHAVAVDYAFDDQTAAVTVQATVRAVERTGVEMEALVAATVAALTIYDMCKAIDRGMVITDACLLYKEGGKSGVYRREAQP